MPVCIHRDECMRVCTSACICTVLKKSYRDIHVLCFPFRLGDVCRSTSGRAKANVHQHVNLLSRVDRSLSRLNHTGPRPKPTLFVSRAHRYIGVAIARAILSRCPDDGDRDSAGQMKPDGQRPRRRMQGQLQMPSFLARSIRVAMVHDRLQ